MKTVASCVVAALTSWLLVGAVVAAPQFVQGPSARYAHSMVYDSARQVVVLFGGNSNAASLGDTWEWDGSNWTQLLSANSPSARAYHAMTYDSVRGRVVLFGGVTSGACTTTLSDTWEWDGTDWQLLSPSQAPGPRWGAATTFDPIAGTVVLFGGVSDCWTYLGGTWEWDGVTWTQRFPATSPMARLSASMVFDLAAGKTTLFGGGVSGGFVADETWQWNGTTWTLLSPAPRPAARASTGMAYVAATAKTVLFGGQVNGGGSLSDTWEWDDTAWTQLNPTLSPSSRSQSQTAYDAARNQVLLFGGRTSGSGNALADTWTFDGTEWHPKLDYVTSPINGNRYALTPPMTWTDAEAFAVQEGGHLATVRNAAEDAWLVQTFAPMWQSSSSMWIGLNDAASEGAFAWSSGEAAPFRAWAPGQPDNQGNEDFVHYIGNGWNDLCPANCAVHMGCIELSVAVPSNATTYGTGCGTPALGFFPTANPIIGTNAGALISNAPNQFAGVTMGWSDSHLSGIPLLPLDLAFIGMPGCSLLHSSDVFGLPVTSLTASTLQFDLALPFQASLLGAHVYLQAYCFAPGENSLEIIASNGIDWLIGNQ